MVKKGAENSNLLLYVILVIGLLVFFNANITGKASTLSRLVSNVPVQCYNGVRDGSETDVDCGGSTCPKCSAGKSCNPPGQYYGVDSNCQTGLKCLDTWPSVSGQNRMFVCGAITETDGGFNLGLNGTLIKTAGSYSLTVSDVCINSVTLNETDTYSTYLGYRAPANCVRSITVCNATNTSCSNTTTTQCSAGACV